MKGLLKLVVPLLFVACNSNDNAKAGTKNESHNDSTHKPSAISQNWHWPDSLDAIAAAPKSHLIVFEDSSVRILQVVCPPGVEERIHTHRHKSTAWFTHSAHFIYYTYVADASNKLVKKDSFEIKGFPAEALNKGQMADPEEPHSIKNIGTDTFMAYRIEYKKQFRD